MEVVKTQKHFIDNKFQRSESGYTDVEVGGRVSVCSKKDFRNAVQAAKGAQAKWQDADAFNRGQILYRMGEMTWGKRQEITGLLVEQGWSIADATQVVEGMVDRFVYYAGFADKYASLLSTLNPVAGNYVNFCRIEALGVCALIDGCEGALDQLVEQLCAMLVAGNAVVVLLTGKSRAFVSLLGEICITGDLPAGVANFVTGEVSKLHAHIGGHYEVAGVGYFHADAEYFRQMQVLGAGNLKRLRKGEPSHPLGLIQDFTEVKAVWQSVAY